MSTICSVILSEALAQIVPTRVLCESGKRAVEGSAVCSNNDIVCGVYRRHFSHFLP
jgi:hypothetical protein